MNTKNLLSLFTLGMLVGFLGLGAFRGMSSGGEPVRSVIKVSNEIEIVRPPTLAKRTNESKVASSEVSVSQSSKAEPKDCDESLEYASDDHSAGANDMSGQQILAAELGEGWIELVNQQSEYLEAGDGSNLSRVEFEEQQRRSAQELEEMESRGLVTEVRF